MNPLNPFFAVIIYLISFLTGHIIKSKYKINPLKGRYECIDGMRGFLALGVFIHHSNIWHQYLHTGYWDNPKSNLYVHLGQTSVLLFFMITSFLFISKLLNSNEKVFNWRNFFLSRVFRLVPMYFFLIWLIIISVMFISQWQVNVAFQDFFASIFKWCLFTINGRPDINNSRFTAIIDAAVEGTLPYEWLFYFSLPLIAIFILKIKPKIWYIILSVIFIAAFYEVHGMFGYFIYSFIGGAVAPFILKFTSFGKKMSDTYASIIILVCLFLILQFSTVYNPFCIVLVTIVFTLIALGASLFGLLKNTTLKFLGEISYSTYLLHGITLFTVFYFVFGLEKVKQLTTIEYSLLVFSIAPLVVLISFWGFKYIEKPYMDKAKTIIGKLDADSVS